MLNDALLLARFDHVIPFTGPNVSDYRRANINGGESYAGELIILSFSSVVNHFFYFNGTFSCVV